MTGERAIAQLAEMIGRAQNVVAFTGAGISTESGVPDFRSPGGVWSRMKPIQFNDFLTDEAFRREGWTRAFTGKTGWTGARPNAGHDALARMVKSGKVSAVITQNVDNLHHDSGIPVEQVIELHGNASFATCLECGLRYELEDLKQAFLARGDIPVCGDCGGLVKVATISFGQPMPPEPMMRAEKAARSCDLFLVLGSSLVVYPAASFPIIAQTQGADLVIVNREPTPQDELADLVVHDEIGRVLTAIAPD